MREWMKTAAITAAIMLALAVGAGFLVIYTGGYNVAATERHWGITRWALNTLQQKSVSARAEDVTGSLPTDSAALARGFDHFHAMCVQCHGAPGQDRGELGKGIRPEPPRLEEVAHEWSDQEIFWITRHGIRLAGMPAFGPTHSEEDLWGITAFVRELEEMTEEEYTRRVTALLEARGGGGGEGEGEDGAADGHQHAPGTPAHGH